MKALAVFFSIAIACSAFGGESVIVPARVDHGEWTKLLNEYVDDRGLVDYSQWKSSPRDLDRLNAYLDQFADEPTSPAIGADQAASLVNLYNALTIRWILENYPTESIQALNNSFGERRHRVGGKNVSLDDIEHATLRPLIGYKAHAVLVCAARSCPPLQRFAFEPDSLDQQIADTYRVWLAREDLNRFQPSKKTAEISSIFNWFKDDFVQAGGTKKILAQHAPSDLRDFLAGGEFEIEYLPYDWGLNDQGKTGNDYSRIRMLWDRFGDVITFWN